MKRLFLTTLYLNFVFSQACSADGDHTLATYDAGTIDCNNPSTWPKGLGCCNNVCIDAGAPSVPCNDAGGVWQYDNAGSLYCGVYR